jgi:hypothetical protein
MDEAPYKLKIMTLFVICELVYLFNVCTIFGNSIVYYHPYVVAIPFIIILSLFFIFWKEPGVPFLYILFLWIVGGGLGVLCLFTFATVTTKVCYIPFIGMLKKVVWRRRRLRQISWQIIKLYHPYEDLEPFISFVEIMVNTASNPEDLLSVYLDLWNDKMNENIQKELEQEREDGIFTEDV